MTDTLPKSKNLDDAMPAMRVKVGIFWDCLDVIMQALTRFVC